MQQAVQFRNLILSKLPSNEAATINRHLEAIELRRGYMLVNADEKIEHVYFLEEGIGSIVAVSPEGHRAESGMFGSEGFAPTPPLAGADFSLHEVMMQASGYGHRISVEALWSVIEGCPVFRERLIKAVHNLATQVSYTALSNAVHQVDERLARWLLMCHDRVVGSQLAITHDYIALMLAVRRPSVTTSLHVLEGNGFIRSERSLITIINRPALLEFARDAFGRPEDEHRMLFPDRS